MSVVFQVGIVGSWRYVIRERSGGGLFVVARQDVEQDILEDEIAFCYSRDVAGVIAAALVARERRKTDSGREFIRRNFSEVGR
jgi:hypothetical protein